MSELVDGMRGRLEVKVEGEDSYLVSYEDREPQTAQLVVDALADRFIHRQVERRAEVAQATVRAFDEETRALRPRLSKLESQVRAFKAAHNGALPEQLEANLRNLDESTLELNIQSSNLELQNEHRRQLLAAAMSPLRHQEDLLTTALHDARTHYTADHPEVRRIEGELAALRAKRIEEERQVRAAGTPELDALDDQIRRTEAELSALRQRQEEVRQRVQETAENAETLARLGTDLDVIKARYQTALAKLNEAELSAALERTLKPLRYEVVEGAALPRYPAHPNRPLWAAGALALAAALALALGFALDARDGAVYSAEELQQVTRPAPLLACVPSLERRRARGPMGTVGKEEA
jgi:uncharacterized protein involved in exopolysaccharide biosynthesis